MSLFIFLYRVCILCSRGRFGLLLNLTYTAFKIVELTYLNQPIEPTNQPTHHTCCQELTSSTPLLSSFQLPISFLPLKVLSPKIPTVEGRSIFFNTLQPHIDCASNIEGVVNHIEWSTMTLTQFASFLFTLTYPLFTLCILCWLVATYHSRLKRFYSLLVISPSYTVLPRLPCFVLIKCFILEHPGFIPVHSCKWFLQYTLGLPLQHPATHPPHTGISPPHAT